MLLIWFQPEGEVVAPAAPGQRDDVALEDIRARLIATTRVELVVVGAGPSEVQVSADRSAVAWVKRTDWSEVKAHAGYRHDRTCRFSLWLSVRGSDPQERWSRLCQLEAAALNAIARKPLGGFCMPAFTIVTAGRDEPTRDAESRVLCTGEFRYMLDDALDSRRTFDP